jgi:hypothetical protein
MSRVASGANFSEASQTSFGSHDARLHAAIQFLSSIPLGAQPPARQPHAGPEPTVQEQPPTVPVTPRETLAATADQKEEKYPADSPAAAGGWCAGAGCVQRCHVTLQLSRLR